MFTIGLTQQCLSRWVLSGWEQSVGFRYMWVLFVVVSYGPGHVIRIIYPIDIWRSPWYVSFWHILSASIYLYIYPLIIVAGKWKEQFLRKYHTLANHFGMKHDFTINLKAIRWICSDQHVSPNYFLTNSYSVFKGYRLAFWYGLDFIDHG